jgi:hypothetical protein
MKMFVAALSALCIAGTAFGQGANEIGYDDGTTETSYKLISPSGPSDWYNVNFHGDAAGTACQLIVDWNNSGSTTASRARFGLYAGSTSFANTPDTLTGILAEVPTAIPVGDGNGTFTYYSIPDVTLGSSDVHMATLDNPGDSTAWLGTDTNGPASGRTFFSSTGYSAAAAGPWSNNWMMRIGVCPPPGTNGCLLVNGKTSDSINMGGTICITFWGGPNAAFLLYLCFGGGPFFKIALPLVFTNTGSPFFPGPRPDAWTICTTVDCSYPTTTTLEFCTIYEDVNDTKLSGKPKLKISKSAFVHFDDPSGVCVSTTGCYGHKDDGAIDFNIWKVQNPAGPSDWFNVNNGTSDPASSITMITGMEISGFDFCGFGPCWEEVGEYAANLAVDATGATPDINSPISTLGSATACITPGSADGNAPYTFYDIPDFAPSSTTIYHAAVKWSTGDSCIWLGSDTDGTDTTVCAKIIPNSGSESLWTLDNYTNPGNRFSGANWGIRTTWTP